MSREEIILGKKSSELIFKCVKLQKRYKVLLPFYYRSNAGKGGGAAVLYSLDNVLLAILEVILNYSWQNYTTQKINKNKLISEKKKNLEALWKIKNTCICLANQDS